MAGGPPVLAIAATDYLGFVSQAAFGTYLATPAASVNWAPFTARDLSFDAMQHAVKAAAGKRATERWQARGMSHALGGFTIPLEPTAGAPLLRHFFGLDTYATVTHTISVTTPQMLSIEKIMAAQSFGYQDCFLEDLTLSQAGAEWTAKYTLLGGLGDTPIVSAVPTLPADSSIFQWGQTTLGAAFGGLTAAEMGAVTLTFKNGVKQFAGAGSFAPTRAAGGEFTASGTMKYLFDSAASAAAQAAYIAGTNATVTVTLTIDATHSLVINEANCMMTAAKPVETLGDFVTVDVTWSVLRPEGITLVLKNDDIAAYV